MMQLIEPGTTSHPLTPTLTQRCTTNSWRGKKQVKYLMKEQPGELVVQEGVGEGERGREEGD